MYKSILKLSTFIPNNLSPFCLVYPSRIEAYFSWFTRTNYYASIFYDGDGAFTNDLGVVSIFERVLLCSCNLVRLECYYIIPCRKISAFN